MKKGHFRLTCVAQKRCCLSSLLSTLALPITNYKFPLKFLEQASGVLSNCIFVNGKQPCSPSWRFRTMPMTSCNGSIFPFPAATGLSSLLFLADVGSVHNFHFEFLERPQLIPFVRAKVSLCFGDDLLRSPKS